MMSSPASAVLQLPQGWLPLTWTPLCLVSPLPAAPVAHQQGHLLQACVSSACLWQAAAAHQLSLLWLVQPGCQPAPLLLKSGPSGLQTRPAAWRSAPLSRLQPSQGALASLQAKAEVCLHPDPRQDPHMPQDLQLAGELAGLDASLSQCISGALHPLPAHMVEACVPGLLCGQELPAPG